MKSQASITNPVPASGTLEFTDDGKLKLTMELDLSREIVKAVMTKNPLALRELTQQAMVALLVELGAKGWHPALKAAVAATPGRSRH